MSKKLLDILPTLQTFQDNVISQLTNMFNGVEWLNDTTSYTKQETIYKLLMLKYGDRYIRYDDESIFLNRLVFDLADFLPDIYAKQQVFIKNKLNEFLSDNKNRAVIIDNTSTNSRNTDNNTKFGNSSSPLNLVISNASEITNAPITSLNLSNVKLLENYNGNNQQVNYNFVNDLIKTLNNDYSLRLNEFMELLGKHFISVVGGYYRNSNDIQTVKDEPYRFNNGYLVNEVDYLCSDNKQEINRFNEKLGRLNDQVATKQNQLTAGSNISINNNVISANIPQTDLSNYYTKQEIDTQEQQQNTNIENNYLKKNGNLQIVNAFVDFYGNICAKNNGYVDNVDTQARTSMINKEYLEQQLNPINTSISNNTTNIATNQNNISNLENRYNTLNNEVVKIAGNQTITGAKTFDNEVIIRKDNTPLILRPVNPGKIYMLMKGADDTTNFSLGANSSNTSLEVNRGDLTITTLQSNKNVNFENIARVKLNRSVLEMGTEINAGFGGGEVKFIPEDNSTKTLQFYNNQPSDTRRFKLLVPEPTEAQNPATKAYVDNAIANSGGSIDTSNFATLNTNQTISGEKTFSNGITITKTNGALQFNPGTNQTAYLEFYNGNTRIGYFGKGSVSNNNIALGARGGKLSIEAPQGTEIHGPVEFGTEIKAGHGATTVKFIPEDNTTKTLQFYNANATDARRFNLLVPEPTQANNPATKNYVDNYINYKEEQATINVNTQGQINPSAGYKVIDVKVARKRQNDGLYFIEYNTPLNYQVFVHSNGKFTVYNSGTPGGFTNDFKFYITEKKV